MDKSQGAVILSIGLVLMSTYLVRTVVPYLPTILEARRSRSPVFSTSAS